MQNLSQLQLHKHELLSYAREAEELAPYLPRIQGTPAPSKIILLTGTFGTGQTWLLNSLVGSTLFPTSPLPMRRYYARLINGSTLMGFVIYERKEAQIEPTQSVLEKIVESDDKNAVVGFDIHGPFPMLRNGWELVETPGLGEINPAHQTLSEEVLPQAMALIFLVDAISSPQASEDEFLHKVPEHVKHLCLVITNVEKIPVNQRLSILNTLLWSMKKIIGRSDYSIVVLSEDANEGLNREDFLWGMQPIVDFIQTVSENSYAGNREYISELIQISKDMLATLDTTTKALKGDRDLSEIASEVDYRQSRVNMLITVIHDQQRDIMHQTIDGYQAQVFKHYRTPPSEFLLTPLVRKIDYEEREYELHEQLLAWLVEQQPILQTSLQELYDKIWAEWTFMTGKQQDRMFVEINMDDLVKRLKRRIHDSRFKRDLLNELNTLITEKAEFLRNQLSRSVADSMPQKIEIPLEKPVRKRIENVMLELNGLIG